MFWFAKVQLFLNPTKLFQIFFSYIVLLPSLAEDILSWHEDNVETQYVVQLQRVKPVTQTLWKNSLIS